MPYRRASFDRIITLFMVGALMVGASACTTVRPADDVDEAPPMPAAVSADENLNATLWAQTSPEYRAVAVQAYELAQIMLDHALADTMWTASLEQASEGGYAGLPPAVVLDVDETVLDNAAYQARLIRDEQEYARDTWNAWVNEAQATPVPGALDFTQYAAEHGVTVIYLTNRQSELEDATRQNLAAYGFPLKEGEDVVVTRGERPEWASGDKGPRREAVAERYRIVMLVGDNLGDFISGVDVSTAERAALVAPYASYWGTRWIVLPNPQYGSWEAALYDFDYGLSRSEKIQRKRGRLHTGRDER